MLLLSGTCSSFLHDLCSCKRKVEDEIAGMMCDSYGNYLCSLDLKSAVPGS